MLLGGSVSPWRSGVEEGRSPLGRFRKPEPCFPRTYATWDAKKDENRFESMKFRIASPSAALSVASGASSRAVRVRMVRFIVISIFETIESKNHNSSLP